ncbi:unnamed protein product [Prorocentrum cordatum]|uniref:Uncharacterized protein n=1 Tax=Prorocentrum cordatum TaxID=2364126 RepID=A0ABN9W614_9DINO|nr:unnamed protein product [Polarella glacialis]
MPTRLVYIWGCPRSWRPWRRTPREANWEFTQDPWHDTELQNIDYTGYEFSDVEKVLMNEGGYALTPLAHRRGRWALTSLVTLRARADSRPLAGLDPRLKTGTLKEIEKEDCDHPICARPQHGNQYARWAKCRMRGARRETTKYTPEDKAQTKLKRETVKKEVDLEEHDQHRSRTAIKARNSDNQQVKKNSAQRPPHSPGSSTAPGPGRLRTRAIPEMAPAKPPPPCAAPTAARSPPARRTDTGGPGRSRSCARPRRAVARRSPSG